MNVQCSIIFTSETDSFLPHSLCFELSPPLLSLFPLYLSLSLLSISLSSLSLSLPPPPPSPYSTPYFYLIQDKLIATLEAKIKESDTAKNKLQKSLQSASGQTSKYKKSADELMQKCDSLEGQLKSLRKVSYMSCDISE